MAMAADGSLYISHYKQALNAPDFWVTRRQGTAGAWTTDVVA